MKRSLYILNRLFSIVFHSMWLAAAIAAQEQTVATRISTLGSIELPARAVRVVDASVPAEIDEALRKIVEAGDGKVRQGEREVLAWTQNYKPSQARGIIDAVTGGLRAGGWTFVVGGENQGVTVFSAFRSSPVKRVLVGFYTTSDDAFVLAWTELVPAGVPASEKPGTEAAIAVNDAVASGLSPASILNVEKNANFVNVSGTRMPPMPKFPILTPKPGFVRGYAKDAGGRPLAGAAIGVRSTLIGGAYSGAQGKTDAKGYYEFAVPRGVAHYYNAGYAIEYGDGLAAIGLHAADGSLDSFASTDGAVENFVLLTYGIPSRENLQENPRLPATYYGGSIYIGHWIVEASDAAVQPHNLVENSTIEITLTPDGPLMDGSTGGQFVVRKVTAAYQSGFYINNIPLGRYRIGASMNGRALKLRLNKPVGTMFGMTPAETTAEASVLFCPGGAKASMVSTNYGAWTAVEIIVEKP